MHAGVAPPLAAAPAAATAVATERIRSLDGIRGIAALVVVLFHLKLTLAQAGEWAGAPLPGLVSTWPVRLLWSGFEAVMVFFVLSGFVLALPFLGPRPPGWGRFAARRLLRLYPPYLAAWAVSALGAVAVTPLRGADTAYLFGQFWNEAHTARTLADSALMWTDHNNVNGAFWSLVHEVRISCLFPLIILAARRLGAVRALVLSACLSLGAMHLIEASLAGGAGGGVGGGAGTSWLRTLFVLVFFMLGIALATHWRDLMARMAGPWRESWLTLVVIGVALMGLNDRLPLGAGSLCVGAGFALVMLVLLSSPRGLAFLEAPVPQFLGRISYSLYLTHLPVLYGLCFLLRGWLPMPLIVALALPAAMLLACGFWRMVENPAIRWSRRVRLA